MGALSLGSQGSRRCWRQGMGQGYAEREPQGQASVQRSDDEAIGTEEGNQKWLLSRETITS